MNITKPTSFGPMNKPKCVLFGPEGSGKSTLGSKLEKPLFLNVEDGISCGVITP
jgi:adenylylsulfate kinase-like enzyme